jgi:hypothetical protein
MLVRSTSCYSTDPGKSAQGTVKHVSSKGKKLQLIGTFITLTKDVKGKGLSATRKTCKPVVTIVERASKVVSLQCISAGDD